MNVKKTSKTESKDNFKLTEADGIRFSEAKKKLASLPSCESSVLQMELIFFDTISMLRKYEHPLPKQLVEQMLWIQENEYKRIHYPKLTTKMRTTAIRTFKNALRTLLTRAINKPLRRKSPAGPEVV